MKIEELLVKHVTGISTEEEEKALQAWLDEDPAHVVYFRRLQKRRNYRELYKAYREANPQRHLSVRRSFNWKRFAMRAAVWALPIMVACGLWFGLNTSEEVAEQIVPGSPKALLYLENGAVVELGNSRELGWIRINDVAMASEENGTLSYEKNQDEKPGTGQQNTLATPRGGEYHLTLPDGTKVHLNSLSELQYPLSFDADKREVTLSGEAYFEVAKDPDRPFYVKANGLTIRQYGTKFSVNARSPQSTTVALEEGSVGVLAPDMEVQMLKPGEVAVWDEGTRSVSVSAANIEPYTAWHRNRFVFDDASLGEMMETLSLWYNVDVRFQDIGLANLHFTGNLSRYEDIGVILKGIETVVDVECQVKDHQIKIMKRPKHK